MAPVRPRLALPVLAIAVALLGAGLASADRKATPDERKAIAKVVELPKACTKARIATVTEAPEWASAEWKPRPADKCSEFAGNGVALLHLKGAKWRFITAGSSFECDSLYEDVPRAVLRDLGVDCS